MEGAPKLPEAPPAAMKSTILLAARLLEGGEARLDPGERSGDGPCRGERRGLLRGLLGGPRGGGRQLSCASSRFLFLLGFFCGSSPRRC